MVEHEAAPEAKAVKAGRSAASSLRTSLPLKLSEIDTDSSEERFSTGLTELDRVLGGGAVRGSLVLVGGEPGIGKSTLVLQFCGNVKQRVLYVSGEESARQLKLRAARLNVANDDLHILPETRLETITEAVQSLQPEILIADSIQTLYSESSDSAPGSVSQIKDCTLSLMRLAKDEGITIFIVGHVNKEGSLAGPKTLEHMVDCVLYFEGERNAGYRLLRAAKNRFGPTNEIGVFEMGGSGLSDVPNPSEMLLSGRPKHTPGTVVTCVMEGTRAVLAEIQALVTPNNSGGNARRNANGIDYNRAMLLLAVLEKRGGLRLSGGDVFVSVIGGLTVDEPAADLAVILALASSWLDVAVNDLTAVIGEVDLTGKLRAVQNLEQRLNEAYRLGFECAVIPNQRRGAITIPKGLTVIECVNIQDALQTTLGKNS
jgi:DNA repair protein RadA/Sms